MLARHKSLPLYVGPRGSRVDFTHSGAKPLLTWFVWNFEHPKMSALEVTLQKHWVNWRVVVDDHHDGMTEPAEPWLFRGGYIDSISQPDACFFFVCYLMHLFLLVDSCSIPSVALRSPRVFIPYASDLNSRFLHFKLLLPSCTFQIYSNISSIELSYFWNPCFFFWVIYHISLPLPHP